MPVTPSRGKNNDKAIENGTHKQDRGKYNMASREYLMVFKPGRIGRLELKNRLVRSATYENAATIHGEVTDPLVEIYRRLGLGGVGLIVTGITSVLAKAHSPHRTMLIDGDKTIPGLRRIPDTVHSLGNGCKILIQLHHPGRQIIRPEDAPKMIPFFSPALVAGLQRAAQGPPSEQRPRPVPAQLPDPVAPSAIPDAMFKRAPRALSIEEIEEIIEAFARGIGRAQEAGFDGVQLHAAHGWLLSSFLSPHTNKRKDRYGGSTENRTRIVQEIFEQGRKRVDNDFPILIKMNTTDFLADGTDLKEAARVAAILKQIGFAALETSGGMWETVTRGEKELGWPPYLLPESRTNIKNKDQEAYFLSGAEAVKKQTGLPVILVGGMRSLEKIEEVLQSGAADFISLARPLIRQPDLPNLWISGEGPEKAACISCNACIGVGDTALKCGQLKE
jgi:2,4-dienoyl-CoA reductase-like NADH-dependent reductase (Old Yellow Enzyme family)